MDVMGRKRGLLHICWPRFKIFSADGCPATEFPWNILGTLSCNAWGTVAWCNTHLDGLQIWWQSISVWKISLLKVCQNALSTGEHFSIPQYGGLWLVAFQPMTSDRTWSCCGLYLRLSYRNGKKNMGYVNTAGCSDLSLDWGIFWETR